MWATIVHDEQGLYWMLGEENGSWYYFDGYTWVEASGSATSQAYGP